MRFIDGARAANKPFFLYFAHNAPHFPLRAEPEDIAKFRGRYEAGRDQMRQRRYNQLKDLGVVSADWPLTPRDATVEAWDALTPKQQDDLDHRMALHAAVIYRLDRSIGVLVDGLKGRDVPDNKLLFFLSDNGASDEGGLLGKFGPGTPGDAQSDVYFGRAWANASNTPFRLYKKNSHEGGIATPLIAHWPAGISAAGQWCTQPTHIIDLMPTCADLAEKWEAWAERAQVTPYLSRR